MNSKLLESLMINIVQKDKFSTFFFIFALCAFLASASLAIIKDTGRDNLYIHQAEAFLHGRLAIPQKLHDVAIYEDQYYVPFPLFPAIVLLPFKALFTTVNTTLISVILSLINLLTAKDILIKLKVDESVSLWLLLAFFLGTGYWISVIWSNGVWFFAHIFAVTFILLSIREVFGKGRGFLAGLFLGFAFLSRQLSIYSSIFIYVALLVNSEQKTKKSKIWMTLNFAFALSFCVLVYLFFNYIRFGNPFDTGYTHLDLGGFLKSRFERFGLFSPAYVPFNLIYMFLQGPHLQFKDSLMPTGIDPFGTSITFASPFLFSAFLAKGNKYIKISAWLAIGLTLTQLMFYYNNGWVQMNTQRFALDFLPLLLVLMALSTESIKNNMVYFRWSVIYSVSLNIFIFLFYAFNQFILNDDLKFIWSIFK